MPCIYTSYYVSYASVPPSHPLPHTHTFTPTPSHPLPHTNSHPLPYTHTLTPTQSCWPLWYCLCWVHNILSEERSIWDGGSFLLWPTGWYPQWWRYWSCVTKHLGTQCLWTLLTIFNLKSANSFCSSFVKMVIKNYHKPGTWGCVSGVNVWMVCVSVCSVVCVSVVCVVWCV